MPNAKSAVGTIAQMGQRPRAHIPVANEAVLVNENIGLVSLAVNLLLRQYPWLENRFDRETLVSMGMPGLLSAIRAHDPRRGQLSTVAVLAIGREILRNREVCCLLEPNSRPPVLSLDALMHADDGSGDRFGEFIVDPACDRHNVFEQEVAGIDTRLLVQVIRSRLTPAEQRVLALHTLGYSAREIIRVVPLGCSHQALSNRIRRLKERVREAYLLADPDLAMP